MSNKTAKTKGPAFTAKCTVPKSQWKRFGITEVQNGRGETDFGETYHNVARARWKKRMSELSVTTRQLEGIAERKLPSPVRSAINYFSRPFSWDGKRSQSSYGEGDAQKIIKV
jgi:hypothetical protein